MGKPCKAEVVGIAFLVLLAAMIFVGCAGPSSLMKEVPEGEAIVSPATGKAMVIFMRPSGIGFGVQAKVLDVTSETDPIMVGYVGAKTRVAYETDPGEKLFMAMGGENTPFMKGQLEADSTYYAKVSPLMGFLYARFTMTPLRSDDTDSPDFRKWLNATTLYGNTEDSYSWMTENKEKILEKRARKLPKWMEKDQEDRDKLTLNPEDGRR